MFPDTFSHKMYKSNKLGDFISDRTIKVSKLKDVEYINYIDISSIDNKTHKIIETTQYQIDQRPLRAQQVIGKNDILISTVRPNLNNISKLDVEDKLYVASTGFCVLKQGDWIDNTYLLHLVTNQKYTNYLMGLISGASYPAITNKDILSFPYENPDFDKQLMFSSFVKQVDKLKYNRDFICYLNYLIFVL